MKPRDLMEARDDSRKSYEVAIRALRERHVRAHAVTPNPDDPEEQRWWDEGPKSPTPTGRTG